MEQIWAWLVANKEEVAALLLGLVAVAEIIVRLTPTQSDDGAVERMGAWIRRFLDAIGLPNKKKIDIPEVKKD